MQRQALLLNLALVGVLASGCSSITTYVKPGAPWGVVKRIAVLPFAIPSENPVDRSLITQLFAEELRKSGHVEVTEVPLESPVGSSGVWDLKRVAKEYQADAVISGSVDDTRGTVIHMQVQDVATQDLLWSGTYLLGSGGEFFSFKTQQQKLKRGFRRLVSRFGKESVAGAS